MRKERWKKIPGFPNYEVSDFGRVKSIGRYVLRSSHPGFPPVKHWQKERILSPRTNKLLYPRVVLSNDAEKNREFKVHRLVAMAFVPNPLNKPEVSHRDHNRTNNFYKNLKWATHEENMKESSGLRLCGRSNPYWGKGRDRTELLMERHR